MHLDCSDMFNYKYSPAIFLQSVFLCIVEKGPTLVLLASTRGGELGNQLSSLASFLVKHNGILLRWFSF
jgi:hypothetical protein